MGATAGWITMVLLVYGGVFLMLHMGYDVGGTIGSALTGMEHLLSRPIIGP